MLLIFPFIGLLLAALTCFIKGDTGSEIILSGFTYLVFYTVAAVMLYVLFIVVLSLLVKKNEENKVFNKLYNNAAILTLRFALEACNVKVKVEGEELIPKNSRFVLIQNHRSMFDPMVTVAFFGKYELGFITKPENTHLPVIGPFMHKICCIAIDRENPRNAVKSINAAANNIENDVCSMAIYPEGTRSKGEEMLSFKNGSLKIATKAKAPLVITTVTNTEKVHSNAPFKRTEVTLKVCDVIPAEEVASSTTADLAEQAQKLMYEALGLEIKE